MAVRVLGDRLTSAHGPLAARPDEPAVTVELRSFARRHPYHPHKPVLVFAAMRHFRDELREAGREVASYRTETFEGGIERFLAEYDEPLVAVEPSSHHIGRLMVLSHFALLYGVDPRQLDEPFQAACVDAYHWVTTPTVVEMGSYGSGAFASKPYAASANYVGRMSNHCFDCAYDEDRATGEGIYSFNALYWEFLGRNEDRLRSNGRMGLVYGHWDGKDEAERAAIRERATGIREAADRGDL